MNDSKAAYKGSCLCGAITFKVDAIEPKMGHCHCSMCRKFHGAEYSTYGEAKRKDFHWLSGESELAAYVAPNGTTRQFCKQCGSSLTFKSAGDSDTVVEFALAALDSDIPQRPDVHIYVGSKANWSVVSDDLPQYVEGRNSELITGY